MDQALVAKAQALLQQGQLEAALQVLQAAVASPAVLPLSLKLLVRLALHQQQLPQAAEALRRALAHSPADAELHALAATGAKLLGDPDGLERAARRALDLDPGQTLAATLLAEGLGARLAFSEGLGVANACLQHAPDDWGLRLARAGLELFAGDADAAASDAGAAARGSRSLQARQLAACSLLYLDDLSAATTMARHRALVLDIAPLPIPPPPRRSSARPLRVGLLSPDLRQHPVGQLIEPLLAAWDPARIVPFCYSDASPDPHTARLQGLCPHWRDLRGRDDDAVARQMQADGIDVLLDLAGHTAGSRPRLLASRVATHQLGYLGYLFDSALANCDGVVGDAWLLPDPSPSARRPLRLAGGFLCHVPGPGTPAVAMRTGAGPLVFGSFNHLAKLSPATIALWARVLHAVPGARLVLCALGLADAGVRERVAARFAAHHIPAARLQLRPPVSDPDAFLAQYADIDVALDPLPFNGGMTTVQALWQGVPVVSLPGERMASRTGLSLLSTAGLHECIARDPDDYIAIASTLAADGDRRRVLRDTLRARMSGQGMTDARRFAADFTDLLERLAAQ